MGIKCKRRNTGVLQVNEKNTTANKKKKNVEESVISYYKEIVEERIRTEIVLEKDEKHLEEVRKHIAYFKEEVDEIEIFTPKVNYSYDVEKKKSLIEERKVLEEKIEGEKEKISEIRKREEDYRNIVSWIKSIHVLEEKEEKFQLDNEKIHMLEIQEMERQRIARELHDSATQNLIALFNKIEFCSNLVDMDGIRCKIELQIVMNYLKSIISEIRGTIYDLRPMSFDDIGMDTTLKQFIDKAKAETDMKINLADEEHVLCEKNMRSVLKLTLFRIIQEGCNNAIKHSGAKKMDIVVSKKEDCVCVVIKDDGKGFLTEELETMNRKDYSGFGLSMMKERVYLLSGEFGIKSEPDKGTEIMVKIPFLKED